MKLPSDLGRSSAFEAASKSVVAYLMDAVPLGAWMVTRYDGDSQVYLSVDSRAYDIVVGGSVAWSETLCQYAVVGLAAQIAPDTQAEAVPEYRALARERDVRSHVGIPIRTSGGVLFGTLCGIDRAEQSADLVNHGPLLDLLTGLLAQVLDADLERTEAARTGELAELRAETDVLTGLYNRRGWDRFVQFEDDRYRRYGDPCSVIILDLDGLKAVNDSLGHHAGDQFIRQAANVLRDTCRESDVLARLGGDEFGIIVTRATRPEAEALLRRLEPAFDEAGVPASFGLAAYRIGSGFAGAWQASDEAMYEAKCRRRAQGGKPRVGELLAAELRAGTAEAS